MQPKWTHLAKNTLYDIKLLKYARLSTVSAIAGGGLGFWPVKHSILELFP